MESKLQSTCIRFAEEHGVLVRKVHVEGRRGWPDLELIFPPSGLTIRVEMKHPNGRGVLSKLQLIEHKRIQKRGGIVYVCESFKHFCEIIREHV